MWNFLSDLILGLACRLLSCLKMAYPAPPTTNNCDQCPASQPALTSQKDHRHLGACIPPGVRTHIWCCPSSILQTKPSLKMRTFIAGFVGVVTPCSPR